MNSQTYRKLEIGDRVALLESRQAYMPYDNIIIPQGAIGVIGSVQVACVRGREGATFACVDFDGPGPGKFRVSAGRKQIATV